MTRTSESPCPATTQRGFTLIEVMVALAISAVALATAYGAINQVSHNAVLSRDRVFANWIGMNRVTELRLAEEWPEVGESDGEVEFAGQLWRWDMDVSDTVVDSLRRIDITMTLDDRPDVPISTVSGFIGPNGPPATAGTPWQYLSVTQVKE